VGKVRWFELRVCPAEIVYVAVAAIQSHFHPYPGFVGQGILRRRIGDVVRLPDDIHHPAYLLVHLMGIVTSIDDVMEFKPGDIGDPDESGDTPVLYLD